MTFNETRRSNLLVELFVEELPPKALRKLGESFAGHLLDGLRTRGLADSDSQLCAFASPRRLAAHITRVAGQAADKAVSQKLMPVAVGLDAAGNPTPALLKKLQALGADASMVPGLQRSGEGKAEALLYQSTVRGATLADGLQAALDEAIAKLPIPKVMSYQLATDCELPGWSSVSFVRPAHGLVALHGAEVVPLFVLGLRSGRQTHGHRFEATVDPIELTDADRYATQLAEEGAVIASFDARRAEIATQLAKAAAQIGAGTRVIDDDALLDEVTALVERPNVLICQFEPEFLEVPSECLILTMKANQKYFPLLNAAGGLTNRFLVVSNITPDDPSAVIQGNERVVRPRLADAKFFFDQDRKKTLASRVEALAQVVYHNQFGSQGERSVRVAQIARSIGQQLGGEALAESASRAAVLAKTDLLTDMVGEFPELQGVMGGYYARHDGLSEVVAIAIEDHYKPRFAGDALPRNMAGAVVALADKLETLYGMFAIGNKPTGERDPFALRRQALGVIRILIEKDLPLLLDDAIAHASKAFDLWYEKQTEERGMQSGFDSLDKRFFYDRIEGLLRDQGYTATEIDAVIAVRPQLLGQVAKRLTAVRAFVELPEAPSLAAANKRIANILRRAAADIDSVLRPDTALLVEPAEQALAAAMRVVTPRADALFDAGDYTTSLQTLAALREPVDAFFENVMVNAEDESLKRNRLALLRTLHQSMNRVADLSKLAVAA
ncbi:MAG: glycine--tRNA ligase subunit beta [Burkholderiaceae bacterium]